MTHAAEQSGGALPSIAFVMPGYAEEPVGGFRVVYEYANRLAELGHPVTVHYLVGTGPGAHASASLRRAAAHYTLRRLRTVRAKVGAGAGWFPLAPSVRERLTPFWTARRELAASDVLVATAWSTADLVASVTQAPQRIGLYLIQHYETWNGGVSPDTIDATWQLPLHKIVIARWLRDHARDLGEDERTTYIPNGLDFDLFRRTRPSAGRDSGAVSMLVSGLPWKGHRFGLEAIEIARRTHPELHVTMFGNGVEPSELPQGNGYRFVGVLSSEQLAELFNETGVFVHTSLEEGWGLPPAEAMACGAAVIAADNHGVLDYLEADHNALVVPRGNAQAIADALIRMVEDSALRLRLAETGHAEILGYSWERAVSSLSATIMGLWNDIAPVGRSQTQRAEPH